jgi:hypothetical protein
MAANKYLALVAGKIKEVFATIVSAGAGNANQLVALDATGKLDQSVMPVGMGAETITGVLASEAISAGSFVNIYNNAGTLNVRNANATTNGKPANGFVLAAVASGAQATVYLLSQTNNQLTGLTIGADYFLSTVSGGVTNTAPSASGNIVQYLGTANSATSLVFANATTIEVA